MSPISNAWKKISEQGIDRCQTPEEGRTVHIVNQSASVIAFIMVLGAGVAYALAFPPIYIFMLFGFMGLFLSIILINQYIHFQWGLAAIFVFASIFVFWEASTFGYESHMHYGFILLVLGAVLNLYNYRLQLYGALVGLVFLIALLYITDFSLFQFAELTPESQVQLDQIEFFLLLLTIGLLALVYANNQRALVEELKATRLKVETQNKALQKINEELDQFVYSVSHDLRSPIASSLGLIELSQQEQDIAVIKEYLKLKKKSLHKLDLYIRELMDFSRNSRLDLQSDEVMFQALLDEMLEDNSYSDRAEHINMALDIHQPHTFVTDQRRLKMILHNLLSNAIRYSNLNQENPYLKVIVRVEEQGAVVKVIDNGVGIHKKHLESIFEMFFRAQENDVGSGLGLYIAKEAADKLGGGIQVESELGKGTTFTVTLPNLAVTSMPQRQSNLVANFSNQGSDRASSRETASSR